MEDLLTELSRPPKSSKAVHHATKKEAAGLALVLTFDYLADEEPRLVFNTPNLTIPYIEPLEEMQPSPIRPKAETPTNNPTQNRPVRINCVFFSPYKPKIFAPSGSDHKSPIDLKQLPTTKCTKHGISGFLPYDHVKRLPEYSCTIYRHPMLKIVHSFDECVLEFPTSAHPVGISGLHMHDAFLMRKYCYQCYQRFSDEDEDDLCMF